MPKEHHTAHVGPAWRIMLRDLGLDEVAVLRRAGLSPGLLDGAGSHIGLDQLFALHNAVDAECDDPTLPLQTGRILSVELFDPALFAAICSPDMNTAASRMGQFKRMVGAFTLDLEMGPQRTTMRYRCKSHPRVPWTLGMSELVFLVAFARRATRHEICPLRVTVMQLPTPVEPYRSFFGCALEQGDGYSVALSSVDANRPFLTHNDAMWDTFEPTLQRRMAQASEARTTSSQVEGALFELLPSGRTELKDVAKELGVGTRTLQRRLAAEDTTWLTVLSHTRERLARHYLKTTELSPAEVSFLLGFEDPNSLFRAFHRWTGTTPESWRAGVRPRD